MAATRSEKGRKMDENRDCSHMLTKKTIFSFILILVGFTLFILFCENAKAETLTVDDDGGADYLSIQDAVDNASSGDTVFVKRGVYSGNIIINKSINLFGENPKNTRVYGGFINSTILIDSSYVNISRLHLGYNCIGINLSGSSHCNISDNFITESFRILCNASGMKLRNSHYNFIFNNTFVGNNEAMTLIESNDNRIIQNIFSSNNVDVFINNSYNNIINYNTFYQANDLVINSTDDNEVNAQYNYWFTENENEINRKVYINVNFDNYLDYDPSKNNPPVLIKEIPSNLSIGEGEFNESLLDLNDYFDDEYISLRYDVVYNSEPSYIKFPINLWHIFQIDARYHYISEHGIEESKWHGTVKVIVNATDILGYNTSSNLFVIKVNDIYEPPMLKSVSMGYTIHGRTEDWPSFNPVRLKEGEKLNFRVRASDDNRISRVEVKVDDKDWKVIYENKSEQKFGEIICCYFNWTVPRNGGGNHTFYFRTFDGTEYSNVTVENVNVEYLGDKQTIGEFLIIYVLFIVLALILIIIIIFMAYLIGRKRLRKYK